MDAEKDFKAEGASMKAFVQLPKALGPDHPRTQAAQKTFAEIEKSLAKAT